MEEVDNIIIHSLRQIGCDIEENISNLSSFNAELIVEVIVKCLKLIKPDLEMSSELSPNMAARLRVGNSLVNYIMELNYNGTIGYQTFLYPSDIELRRLLLFLIEKFPKEDKVKDTKVSELSLLEKYVVEAVSKSLADPWLPHYCHRHEVKFAGETKVPYNSIRLDVPSKLKKSEDYDTYYKNYQKSVPEQVTVIKDILPCVVSHNAKLLYSNPTNIIDRLHWISQQQPKMSTPEDLPSSSNTLENISIPKSDEMLHSKEPEMKSQIKSMSEKEALEKKEHAPESKIKRFHDECSCLGLRIEMEQNNVEKLNANISQVTLNLQSEQHELIVLEEQKKMIARSYDLLSDGEINIEKLERVIETKKYKLINLATEWEENRKPLIQKLRTQKENNSSKSKVDEIRLFQEKQRELDQELKNKEQLYIHLVNEVQKVSKDTNRSAYTQRILEIINNIRKQKDEIEKVIEDTRNIKKEINILTGRLERSYAVAKELCIGVKERYLLNALHSKFNSLIDSVKKTGAIIREIRDLEEQIDTESAKNVEANLERITADLKQMAQESDALTAQLKMQNITL